MTHPSYPKIVQGPNLGDLLKYETPNLYSREQANVAAGQNLVLGTVVGKLTSNEKLVALDPDAHDGSEIAAGVLGVDIDATLIDNNYGFYIARDAIVASVAVVWPAGITAAQKATAKDQLQTLGILIRQSA